MLEVQLQREVGPGYFEEEAQEENPVQEEGKLEWEGVRAQMNRLQLMQEGTSCLELVLHFECEDRKEHIFGRQS